jgi:hypothetical protein
MVQQQRMVEQSSDMRQKRPNNINFVPYNRNQPKLQRVVS